MVTPRRTKRQDENTFDQTAQDSAHQSNGTPGTAPGTVTLAPHHLRVLTDRAIASEVAKQRGYHTAYQPGDLIDRTFNKTQAKHAPALIIPRWNVQGTQDGWVMRPDSPRLVKDKVAKYEPPKGSHNILDVHPRAQPLLGNPGVPLWITEGILKGDSLVSQGVCAIALNGVWGFKGSNEHGGKGLLPDWNYVALNSREVLVVFDSDIYHKRDVNKALKALYTFLRHKEAIPRLVQWPEEYRTQKWGVDDFFAAGHTLADLLAMVPPQGPLPARPPRGTAHGTATEEGPDTPAWMAKMLRQKNGTPEQTIRNLILAITHLEPWRSQKCWYDLVRERHMVGSAPVEPGDDTAAGVRIEEATQIRVRNLALVGKALDHVCRQTTRDLLREWVDRLPDAQPGDLLTTWLHTYASVPDIVSDAYVEDLSRIIPVGMIARILKPGCQFRYVPILEGAEDIGKSKLVKALAGADAYGRSWHVALSAGMEGKEAHMMLDGALIAELEELSSYTKTDENRMKALITAQTDSFVPKFANKRVDHPRRTIFIATVNPEGDGRYLKGQTGNTRYLPLKVGAIDIPGFLAIRTQLFAEAKAYYLAHLDDWWKLHAGEDIATEREERRQASVYEDSLHAWLQGKSETTWEEIARDYLLLEAKEKWKDRSLQMEVGKALRAIGWAVGQHKRNGRNTNVWRPA